MPHIYLIYRGLCTLLCLITLFFASFTDVCAQNLSPAQQAENRRLQALDDLLQEYLEAYSTPYFLDEATELPSQADWLDDLRLRFEQYEQHPLPINTATREELLDLPLNLTEPNQRKLVDAILDYRRKQPFEHLHELLKVPGIGPARYEQLWPFFSIHSSIETYLWHPGFWTQNLKVQSLQSIAEEFPRPISATKPATQSGFMGSPTYLRQRLQLTARHWSMHWAKDKDAGEALSTLSQELKRPNTAHFALYDLKFSPSATLESLHIGTLKLSGGSGLLHSSGGYRSSNHLSNRTFRPARVRAVQGFSEQLGIQGMGANLSWYGSSRQHYGMVLLGRLQEQGTGFTRTLREQAKAESLESYPIHGMHLSSVPLASQARSLSWGLDFFRVEDDLLLALNTRTLLEDVLLELGLSGNAGTAGTTETTETASSALSMVSAIHYQPSFSPWQFSFRAFHLNGRNDLMHSELPNFGREWGSFSRASTQQGWELGAEANILESIQLYLRLGSDQEMLPSGYDRFPEQRSEWSIGGVLQRSPKEPSLQVRYQQRIQDSLHRAHLQLSLPFGREFRFKSRVAFAQTTQSEKLLGYLWYHELRYQKDTWFTLNARYIQFQSSDHQTRLYVYEPSIRYSFSMASWQGRGHSFLVLASVTPQINDAKKLRFQLQMSYQYAQYIGEKSTGSWLNERLGNQQHTLKGQMIMYWK
jgi:hypothetical protein